MKTHLLKTIENSRNYTLAVAEAMPEQGYGNKITKETWSFGELLNHIAYGIEWWERNYIKGIQSEWAPPAGEVSKKGVREYLVKAYDNLQNTISGSVIGDDILKGFCSTIDHITHHRGQAVLHLRNQGIAPPDYVY